MPRRPASRHASAPYRIKDVSELTGVSREAIRFYINQGLLPEPVKSAHNMAWYSDRHVELLRMIQNLQKERFLPLKAIKSMIAGKTEDLDFNPVQKRAFEEMRRKIAAEHSDVVVTDDPQRLAGEMGLSRAEQQELRQLGVAASGKATMSDVEIARQWIAIRDAGLSLERGFRPSDMAYMWDIVDIAFRAEVEIFRDRIQYRGLEEASRVVGEVIPALNRLFTLLHDRRVAEFLDDLGRQAELAQAGSGAVSAPRRAAPKKKPAARRTRTPK